MSISSNSFKDHNSDDRDNEAVLRILPHEGQGSERPTLPPKSTLRIHTLAEGSDNLSVATRLTSRQSELYSSTSMNMHAEILANMPILIGERVDDISEKDSFWNDVLLESGFQYFSQHEAEKIENALSAGIPAGVRAVYYLKVMQISAIMDPTMYNGFLKKAKLAHWEGSQIEWETYSEALRESLQVFHYCVLEILKPSSLENNHRTFRFIASVALRLTEIPELSKPEILAILIKFHALLNSLSKEEFCYKASRSLEDITSKLFGHIVKQGIDLSEFFKKVLLGTLVTDLSKEISNRIMDLLVLEGFDYLHRVIIALFQQEEKSIFALNGDALYEHVFSAEFTGNIQLGTLERALLVSPALVKYENEFSLLSVNAISGNECELANLKELHEDLQTQLHDMKRKTQLLSKTEAEIVEQSNELKAELKGAQLEKYALASQANKLRARYAQLTMNENLTNLVNANKEISAENKDLESRIALLEKDISAKSVKLKKKGVNKT